MNENPEGMIATLTKTIKNNWRLLLVGAIILAIALNSSQSENKSSTENKNSITPTAQTEQSKQSEPNKPETTTQTAENSTPAPTPTKTPKTVNTNIISETAAKSEGVTHLARRAVKEYLNNTAESLNAEQKIYAEDYLKKKTGTKMLEIGEKVEFSIDLIKQSIEKAKGLNQKQIENLSKYVPLARNLN